MNSRTRKPTTISTRALVAVGNSSRRHSRVDTFFEEVFFLLKATLELTHVRPYCCSDSGSEIAGETAEVVLISLVELTPEFDWTREL